MDTSWEDETVEYRWDLDSEDTTSHTAPYWSYLKVGNINDHKWQSNCRFKMDLQSGFIGGPFVGSWRVSWMFMNCIQQQFATVSDRTMQKFIVSAKYYKTAWMRTLNHSQNEEYLLLWTANGKLQNLFAKHSFAIFVFCLVWTRLAFLFGQPFSRSAALAMGSEDFWYNEQRLPELIGGTWKKKGGQSCNHNEVKVKANVGHPASPSKLP